MRLRHFVTVSLVAAATAPTAAAASAVATQLAAANNHSCALLADHTVKCWGSNDSGELGQGDTNPRGPNAGTMGAALAAISLGTGRTARQIAAGNAFSCAILDDQSVKCWGANESGELGQGDTVNRGDLANTMGDALKPVSLGTGRSALALALGGNHACALLDDHTVKCWGLNDNGQLGAGDANNRGALATDMGDALKPVNLGTGRTATQLAAAGANTCAILDNATLKCWGNNDNGQLGQGDQTGRGSSPDQLGDGLPAIALGAAGVPASVTVGGGNVCALLRDGTVRCWGRNDSGQLGEGTTRSRGDQPNSMGAALPAMRLDAGLPTRAVQCGSDSQCCALFANNALKCWGLNDIGELGSEDTASRGGAAGQMGDQLPFVALGHFAVVQQVTIGTQHMCALLKGGGVKCWGSAQNGQLGYEDQTSRGGNIGDMGDKLPFVAL